MGAYRLRALMIAHMTIASAAHSSQDITRRRHIARTSLSISRHRDAACVADAVTSARLTFLMVKSVGLKFQGLTDFEDQFMRQLVSLGF
jgi:hypothetical protein